MNLTCMRKGKKGPLVKYKWRQWKMRPEKAGLDHIKPVGRGRAWILFQVR